MTFTKIILNSWKTAVITLGMSMLTPAIALAQQVEREYYGHHMWGAGWFYGPIMMIVFMGVLVILLVLLVRWLSGQGQVGNLENRPNRSPMDILNERFARGEIDKEEFEERRRILAEHG